MIKVFTDKLPETREIKLIIDGANVAYGTNQNGKRQAKISNIIILIEKLESMGINDYKIICDHSLYNNILGKKDYKELKRKGIIIETPLKTPADIFILQYAYEHDSYIISNDRFRDYYNIFDENWIQEKLISFLFIGNNIYMDKLIKLGKH